MSDKIFWGIHAGKSGNAANLFLKKNQIVLGLPEAGDFSDLPKDREAFKSRIAQCLPNAKPGAIPNYAGQLYRFVHEVQIGDLVAYPSKIDRRIHLGRVTGAYKYQPSQDEKYQNTRTVEWLRDEPRTHFSQGALYEIGSAMSFFQIKNYADEFRGALFGKPVAPSVTTDETVSLVADEIEEITRDFILKTLAQQLKGHAFAHFVAHLLERIGYHTRVSPEGPDGGIDIIAHKDELGFEPPIVKVQVKSTEGNVGNPQVAELYGNVSAQEFGLFVTLGSFTKQAITFARSKPNLRLIDGGDLVKLILTHYDRFDSSYKGVFPLRRVFIPDAVTDAESL